MKMTDEQTHKLAMQIFTHLCAQTQERVQVNDVRSEEERHSVEVKPGYCLDEFEDCRQETADTAISCALEFQKVWNKRVGH